MGISEPTVFIVDDDGSVRHLIQSLAESVGLRVETHENAQSFLDAYDPAAPGCLVTDVRLPVMSGLELQERLMARGSELPVIVITGHADVPLAVRALRAGALDFIEKPLDEQRILERVQEGIRHDAKARAERAALEAIAERARALTPRERQVMDLVVTGRPNKQIAPELELSTKTVEMHRARVMEKMQADSLAELVRMAVALDDIQGKT